MDAFNRWIPTLEKSLAYCIFRSHHTEINHIYWAHRAALRGVFSLTKGKAKTDSSDSVLPNPGGERRRAISLEEWTDDYNHFDNWTRLAAVIAIAGYLELFIRSAVEAACQSCPAVLIGRHREVDGVELLKSKSNYGFAKQAEGCVKGAWQQRLAAHKQLFGNCPQFLEDNIAELEKMRTLRNAVGHAFGRNPSPPRIGEDVATQPANTVNHNRLLRYLELAYKVAEAVEAQLGADYIGSYETIAMYHHWDQRGDGMKLDQRQFRHHFSVTVRPGLSLRYFTALITYYSKT